MCCLQAGDWPGPIPAFCSDSLLFLAAASWGHVHAGALHITQNEHCEPATIVAVFGSANPSAAFYPFTEGAMPANTLASYYGGTVTKQTAQTPFLTAQLAGCFCP